MELLFYKGTSNTGGKRGFELTYSSYTEGVLKIYLTRTPNSLTMLKYTEMLARKSLLFAKFTPWTLIYFKQNFTLWKGPLLKITLLNVYISEKFYIFIE